jgi:ligand-binding sensor domain-containing protein
MILKRIILLSVLFACLENFSFSQNKFWEQTNGPTGGRVMSMTIDASGTLFCGTQGGTLFQYSGKEQLWKPLFLGATRDNIISIVTDTENRIYFATTKDGLFRSTEQNSGWEKINSGLSDLEIAGLAILPDGILFAATSAGLYKSVNRGENWSKVEKINKPANSCMVDKQIIYVAHNDSLISYSSDGGQNWKNLPMLKNNSITCLAIGKDQHVYAGTKSGDVLKAETGNPIWNTVTTFNYPVWVLQGDQDGNLYVGLGGPDFSNEGGGVYLISGNFEKPKLLFPESIW